MKRFKLTDAHLKLLHNANVDWDGDEWGAPCIDSKRPYGNGDLHKDMLEILGLSVEIEGEYEGVSEGVAEMLEGLHRQTKVALQIVLSTGKFEAGVYEADDYGRKWRKVSQ